MAGGIGSRISEADMPKYTWNNNDVSIIGQMVQMLIDNNIEVAITIGNKVDLV